MKNPLYLVLIVFLPAMLAHSAPFARDEADAARVAQVKLENQPIPDQENGVFLNPILPGHYHDPTVLRVGEDYYMTHCEHDNRGPIMWHSRDLINWRPIGRIESLAGLGDIWATDLIYHNDKYYLYLPLRMRRRTTPEQHLSFSNYVITADDPAGPWSDPVDLGNIRGIDPGHVVSPEGDRYVYVNKGVVSPLSEDGLSTIGPPEKVYDGWPIPEDWVVECDCLESPKLFWRDGWCYMVSAIGGTAGPSTSHMAIVARSRSAVGPWENDPDSPLLRTWSRDEPWWSQGHGTIIEAKDGTWWMFYHGIANGRRSAGRSTLAVPIEWSDDGWPVVGKPVDDDGNYLMPKGENVGHGMPLSDDFSSDTLAIQWDYDPDFEGRIKSGGGSLELEASGSGPRTATRIAQLPVNNSYEVTVKVEAESGVTAGMSLLSSHGTVGIELKDGKVIHTRRGNPAVPDSFPENAAWLRIRNVDHDVTFYYSKDGANWSKHEWGAALSTETVQRIVLYAAGEGEATFKDYQYKGL